MGRLTSAEYAKTHGAAAGRQLHRERVQQFKHSEATRRLAEQRVAKSVGPGSRHDLEGKVGARLDKRFGRDTKPFVTTMEWFGGAKPGHFKGWSKYDKVSAKVGYLPQTDEVKDKDIHSSVLLGGHEATRRLNQIYAKSFPLRTSDEDRSLDRLVNDLAPGLKKSHPLFRLISNRIVKGPHSGPITKSESGLFSTSRISGKDAQKAMYR